MEKNKIIGLVTVTALGLGTLSSINHQKVDAASTYKVQLTHNAAIYSSRGARSSRIILKKGKVYSAYSIKKIRGKKYYHLTKGRYIKKSNAKKYTVQSDKALFTVNVPNEVKAYETPNGNKADTYVAGEHKVYEQKVDVQGTNWYRIGKNIWISSKDTDKPQGSKTSNNITSTSQNTINTTQSTKTNISQSGNIDNPTPATKPILPPAPTIKLDRQTIEATSKAYIRIVNNWRAGHGVSPIIYNGSLYDHAIQRAEHNAHSWDETKHSDHHSGALYGESMTLVRYGTPTEMAQAAFNSFVYNDASANYAHRDGLIDPDLKKVCVGLAVTTNNGYYKDGVSFVVIENTH